MSSLASDQEILIRELMEGSLILLAHRDIYLVENDPVAFNGTDLIQAHY